MPILKPAAKLRKISDKTLEVNTKVELQSSIMGCVKGIMTDVCQTDIVGKVGIDHIVLHATTQTESSIYPAEVIVIK